jgi:TonB family protein
VLIVPAKALGDTTAPVKTAPAKSKPPAPKPEPGATKKAPKKTAVATPQPETEVQRQAPATTPSDSTTDDSSGASSRRRGGPDGTAFGTTPFGSSEASLDDPNFMYGYYVQQMLALIGSHWVRPRANPGTEMVLHYNITRNGQLTDIEVVEESGNRSFDLAGFRAVALASPLPPLPQSYRLDSLGVTLVIK